MARISFSSLQKQTSLPRRGSSIPVLGRFSRFIKGLPSSDRLIAGVLGLWLLIACIVALIAFTRTFQIVVPAHGGTLNEGVVGSPRFVNPILAISDSDRDLTTLTYAGLLGHNAKGELIPVLADSYTVSPDGKTYTFVIRATATFSDGSPVTADDVVYTVQKAQDPALKSPVFASWANIRAEATDARTVRFTLPNAYAPFLQDATLGIMPEHVWKNVSDAEFPFSPYTSSPIAAGPFTVSSITKDKNGVITQYHLSAFTGYALGKPYLSGIKMSFYGDAASLAAALSSGHVTSAYGVASSNAQTTSYARVIGVFFNPAQDAALTDTNVRKALSLAIDRTTLTKTTLGGYATPIFGPLPAGSGIAQPSLPNDATRIDDAKTALTKAGYTFNANSGTWNKSKGGKELTMIITTSNVPELKTAAIRVQSDWQKLGIPTELNVVDPADVTQTVIRPRAYSALLFGEVIGTNPDLYAFWAGSEKADPGLNIADYSNARVDTLLQKARTSSDIAQKNQALADASLEIANDFPAAFLYSPKFLYTKPQTIHDVSLSPVGAPADRFWDISHWYRYSEYVWPFFAHH